eukprot:TRINITY_DN32807_c0_g1_i1.p1 TRINITY_DN32807_c0_g1~~TRINITY_DN32807_c0_g1_i1.p1  ORF type:complete len:323 (+),score=66.73 TRINITY_DN32807_c0_g1_i1:89-1057(+)
MMWNVESLRTINIKGSSPSALPNNLSTNGKVVTFAHKTKPYSVGVIGPEESRGTRSIPFCDKTTVTQTGWVHIEGNAYLVIGTTHGAVIVDQQGDMLLHNESTKLETTSTPGAPHREVYHRGISGVFGTNLVLVGDSRGRVMVFEIRVKAVKLLREFSLDSGITDIAMVPNKPQVVICDLGGNAQLWSFAGGEAKKEKNLFNTEGVMITSVQVIDNVVCAALSSGLLVLKTFAEDSNMVEIGAHLRAVTASASHQKLGLVATVSHDTVIRVWKISSADGHPQVSLHCEVTVENASLVGVAFVGDEIVATAYDNDKLFMIPPS